MLTWLAKCTIPEGGRVSGCLDQLGIMPTLPSLAGAGGKLVNKVKGM